MNKRFLSYVAVFIVGVVVGSVSSLLIYWALVGGSGQASQPITAPTVVVVETPIETAEASNTTTLYRIDPAASEARFSLLDDGRDVVGVTNEVAGDILVDLENPQNTTLGIMRVNLRTLQTDSRQRDQAIRADILLSAQDAFEFGEFTPTELNGLPAEVQIGEPFSFVIEGNLSLRGIQQAVTFDTTVTLVDQETLIGEAQATVLRSDYQLEGVVGASDEVQIVVELQATALE